MTTITHTQVQELVSQLPEAKLATAYDLLRSLLRQSGPKPMQPTEFMRLPLRERRRLMAQQATYWVDSYEQTSIERDEWQAGEFTDH